MHDQTLTIPQHADPIARGLLFVLVAAVLGLAVALPAPATQASAPIVIFATPALRTLPMTARLDTAPSSLPTAPPTDVPTEPPATQEGVAPAVAPTLQPPVPPATAVPEPPALEQANTTAGGAAPEDAPVDTANNSPLVASGPQVPQGPQQVHQQPDSTYITVGDSPLRYYVDPDGHVAEVRLPGVDTAANGADIAAISRATAAPSAAPAPASPTKGRGYLPRAGYRPVRP